MANHVAEIAVTNELADVFVCAATKGNVFGVARKLHVHAPRASKSSPLHPLNTGGLLPVLPGEFVVVLGAMPAAENYQVLAKNYHIRMAKLKAATARAISSRSRPTHGMT